MASLTLSSQRVRLLKTVKRAFDRAGWKVQSGNGISYDFRVDCGVLRYFIKCFDETRLNFESELKIVTDVEHHTRTLRVSRHQLVVVLDRNFLSVSLDSLLLQEIFAVTVDTLESVTGLAAFRGHDPGQIDQRQMYLLQRCHEYSAFISELHHKNGDFAEAIRWGRYVVEHSVGSTDAHARLFALLKEAGEYDEAVELGQAICGFRQDDPHFLRGMEDLARKRGNPAEAAQWHRRLTEKPTVARTFNDILANQRMHNRSTASSPAAMSNLPQVARRAGLGRVIARFFRTSED
jgi:hypothetical protein